MLACSLVSLLQPTEAAPTQAPLEESPQPGESQRRCGDGVCDGPEDEENCPDDCAPPQGESAQPGSGAVSEHWVTNPTTGAKLYVHITFPQNQGAGSFPALVVVPGGIGAGNKFRTPGAMGELLAGAGIVAVSFDPDGRGPDDYASTVAVGQSISVYGGVAADKCLCGVEHRPLSIMVTADEYRPAPSIA